MHWGTHTVSQIKLNQISVPQMASHRFLPIFSDTLKSSDTLKEMADYPFLWLGKSHTHSL